MLIKIFNYAIAIIIAIPLIIGAYYIIYAARRMTKSETKEQIKDAGFFKLSAVLIAFVMTLVYCTGLLVINSRNASATITLNYAEASMGLNSNKTRFNMNEIICDEVIERMIKNGGFQDVKVSDFKNCFKVTPLVDGNSYDKDEYHISTDYTIEYTAPSNMLGYPANTVLGVMCEAYREYYFDKYTVNFSISDDYADEADDLDYCDKVVYLTTKADEVLLYLYGLNNASTSYVSSTGVTFDSLSARVFNLVNDQINNELYSFIYENGISKNADSYIARLEYDNTQFGFDKDKQQANFTVTNEAVVKYAEEMATSVLVPTRDSTGEYYMGRTKIGVDEMSQQANQYSQEYSKLVDQIEHNAFKIKYLSSSTGNTKANQAEADRLIDQAYNSIIKYAEMARIIGREYYTTQMNQGITASVSSNSILSMIGYIIAVFVFTYFAIIAYLIGKKMKQYCKEVN